MGALLSRWPKECERSNIYEDIDLTYERDEGSIGSKITWSIYTLVGKLEVSLVLYFKSGNVIFSHRAVSGLSGAGKLITI